MRNAHNALHSVAWFVAEADGTVLGEIASGNIQTVCAFPTDLSASKSFAGTGLEAADTCNGAHRLAARVNSLNFRTGKASPRSGAMSYNASVRRPIKASGGKHRSPTAEYCLEVWSKWRVLTQRRGPNFPR